MMADEAAPRHATTLSSLNIVQEHNKLNRVHEFPLRKQGAVISLSSGRDHDESVPGPRKISSRSVPEGKDALVLLHNGNHGAHGAHGAHGGGDTNAYSQAESEKDTEDAGDETGVEEDSVDAQATQVAVRSVVPDGGWGWAVVAAAFFINMASDGISFSFGLLYIEFLRYFGESRSTTSWIGSLFMAVPMLTGPMASAMVDRYGCRATTILGGVISAIGFIIAAFSSTIGQMYLTFGVLAGLGLGLCFITAVVSIAYWFERKRTLAMSLGAAGTGFGTFIYAPMTNHFISEYGWRGTVLLLAGTFLNLCVCGVVMRDPAWWAAEQRRVRRARRSRRAGPDDEQSAAPADPDELVPLAPISRVARSLPYTRPMTMTTRSEDNLASIASLSAFLPSRPAIPTALPGTLNLNPLGSSASAPPTPCAPCAPCAPCVLQQSGPGSGPGPPFNAIPELYHDEQEQAGASPSSTPLLPVACGARAVPGGPSTATLAAAPGTAPGAAPGAAPGPRRANSCSPFSSSPLRAESLPCFRRRVSLSTATATPVYNAHPTLVAPSLTAGSSPSRRTSSLVSSATCSPWRSCCPDVLSRRSSGKRWYSDTVDLVRAMLDFSLFLELHFLLMSVGTTLLYTWFVVPYFYLADHLTRNGYTEAEASRLLGVVGVANTVGMVVLGWVGDHPRLNVTKTYALCLAVCGTATACMLIFTDRYVLLMLSCAAFGVTFASTFSFTPTILVTLVPMERFTIAYGLNLLCQGIGNLLGPPFAGWLFDVTHSWDWSFYMAGFWIVVAGFLTGLIPYTKNRHFFGSALERGLDVGQEGGQGGDPDGDLESRPVPGTAPSKSSSMSVS